MSARYVLCVFLLAFFFPFPLLCVLSAFCLCGSASRLPSASVALRLVCLRPLSLWLCDLSASHPALRPVCSPISSASCLLTLFLFLSSASCLPSASVALRPVCLRPLWLCVLSVFGLSLCGSATCLLPTRLCVLSALPSALRPVCPPYLSLSVPVPFLVPVPVLGASLPQTGRTAPYL